MSARRGFTILELLIFAAIFAVAMAGFITVLVTVTRVQSRQASANEVETQGQFLLQQFQYYIQSARLADMTQDVATGTLKLRESSSSIDPTFITVASGTVYLQQGASSTPQALTSNKITVSNITFTRHYNLNGSSMAYGTDSVSYAFTVSANNTNGTQQYSQVFQSSAAVEAPIPKIAMIQQTSTIFFGTSTSLADTYISNNTSGSLLIAVVSNTDLVSVSLADTASDTWSRVASATYPVYGQELNVFAAVNRRAARIR